MNDVLRGSPLLDESLPAFARFVVPALADWVAVDVADGDGVFHRVAVAHVDPARAEAARALEGRYSAAGEVPWGPLRVTRTERMLYAAAFRDPALLATAADSASLARVRELGMGVAVCLQLRAQGSTQGVLSCVRVAPRGFTPSELSIVRTVAGRLGEAVLHGRLVRELRAASRAKDQFIAMLGHELRNPIAAVRQAIHALERLGPLEGPAGALHGIIDRQTRHLTRLVDDLLDVARLTSGKISLRNEPVDLRDAVERCLGTLAPARRGHDVSLHGGRVVVDADPTRLDQIIGNLLENALKYTPAGGRIQVTVSGSDAVGSLHIRDSGVGIPAEVLPRLFEPFAQGEQALARERGGLGMGLALVRRLVELHGGTISLASPGSGQGTTVEVRLPLADPGRARSEPPPASAATSGVRNVLIVEDNADVRDALRWLLESERHEVRTARNGPEALDLVRRSRPDVALVDIGLPGMDGYELARHLRATPGGGSIRLVALTGYGQPEDRRRTREAGFEAHLVKPVEPDELMRLLAVDGSRRLDESA